MITPKREGIMVWFALGLMLGGFLGLLLMGLFASNRRFNHDAMNDYGDGASKKHIEDWLKAAE
jgi:hypothetical protein